MTSRVLTNGWSILAKCYIKKHSEAIYMGGIIKPWLVIFLVSSSFSIMGCATTSSHRGGLFINQSEFYPDPDDQSVLLWEREYGRRGKQHYTKIILDPLLLLFQPEGGRQVVKPGEMKAMADLFRAELIQKLGVAYELAHRVGEDVLRVRIAITDLIPISFPQDRQLGVPAPFVVDVSAAILEVEILDSESSKRLLALIVRGGDMISSPVNQPKDENDPLEKAFRKWAGDIRRGLDRASRL
jgi:hypothetical protein